jgi:hypothetical protein
MAFFEKTALVTHEIFASNLILGESMFVGLKLPPTWKLAPGVSRPEIAAAHDRRNRKWVAAGDAWYVVHDEERKWVMELAIRIRALPRGQNGQGEIASAGGHAARVDWKDRRRGLPWQRHSVTFMTVTYVCPISEREIRLEFSGWCPLEGFREMLASLEHLVCH